MALQKAITTPSGISLPAGYARISSFSGDKTTTNFIVLWYLNSAARHQQKQAVLPERFSCPTPTGEMLIGLYTYLKTLPEFAGAVNI